MCVYLYIHVCMADLSPAGRTGAGRAPHTAGRPADSGPGQRRCSCVPPAGCRYGSMSLWCSPDTCWSWSHCRGRAPHSPAETHTFHLHWVHLADAFSPSDQGRSFLQATEADTRAAFSKVHPVMNPPVFDVSVGAVERPLTLLSLKPFSLTARLFQNRNAWSFSVRIFRASGGGRGTRHTQNIVN